MDEDEWKDLEKETEIEEIQIEYTDEIISYIDEEISISSRNLSPGNTEYFRSKVHTMN